MTDAVGLVLDAVLIVVYFVVELARGERARLIEAARTLRI